MLADFLCLWDQHEFSWHLLQSCKFAKQSRLSEIYILFVELGNNRFLNWWNLIGGKGKSKSHIRLVWWGVPVRGYTCPGPSTLWGREVSSFLRLLYLPSASTGSPCAAGWTVNELPTNQRPLFFQWVCAPCIMLANLFNLVNLWVPKENKTKRNYFYQSGQQRIFDRKVKVTKTFVSLIFRAV